MAPITQTLSDQVTGMAPTAAPPGLDAGGSRAATVSRRWLTALLAVVPAGVGLPLLDAFFWGGWLRSTLPADPSEWVVWALFFNAPHLIASELTLFDREYFAHYRRHILIGGGLCIGVVALVTLTMDEAHAAILGIVVTNYHIMAQQAGLTRPIGGVSGRWVSAWKWLAVMELNLLVLVPLGPVVHLLAALLLVPLGVVAVRLMRRARDGTGRLYILASFVMFVAFAPLATTGYGFFAIAMARIVHDVTAFAVYTTHDRNRNVDRPHNLIYRGLRFLRLPVWVVLPLLSVILAYLLSHAGGGQGLVLFIAPIALFHYFMESLMWRGESPHRRAVAFS